MTNPPPRSSQPAIPDTIRVIRDTSPGLLCHLDRAWLRVQPTVEDWFCRLLTLMFCKRSPKK